MKENPTELIDQFLDHARKSGMIDALRSAAFTIAIDADRPDLRMALQIGVALLWEKPLLLVLRPGQKIPQRLRDLADEVVELPSEDLNDPLTQAKMTAAIVRMTERVAAKERRSI